MVPDYQTLMLPLLQYAGEKGTEVSTGQAVEVLAGRLRLSDEDLREMLPSGMQSTIVNRVGWASTYMKKAGLLEATRRGYYRITARGRELLASKPTRIDVKQLRNYPEFVEFTQLKGTRGGKPVTQVADSERATASTPWEVAENAYQDLRDELAAELLQKLKQGAPAFFEQVVVDLLVKMGYGGSRKDAGKAIGRSGDGGIDGMIKEDKLGLDVIYLQAKRWDSNPVGRPDVMQFAGALQAQRAAKGVFITTSRFTDDARTYVSRIGSKIVLIDGEELANFMIEHDVGVSTVAIFPVKRVDADYFEEGG